MAFANYEKKDNIGIITLNRPDRLNAMSHPLLADLDAACQEFENDRGVRVAILTGAGRAFCAGADIKEMAKLKPGEAGTLPVREGINKVTKPLVAAVNGPATGGGLGLVMGCDIRIAAESARFGMAEVKFALHGGPQGMLADGLTMAAAMEIILLGDFITAQRAYEMGLVNQVVNDEELMPMATMTAQKIAELSPRATSSIRKAKLRAVESYQKIFATERRQEGDAPLFQSEDSKEAIRAFVEKRKPVFRD